jgi:hypothetical protein
MTGRKLRPFHLKGDGVVVVFNQDTADAFYNIISTLYTAQNLGVDLGLAAMEDSEIMTVYDSIEYSIEEGDYVSLDEDGDYMFTIDPSELIFEDDLNADEEGIDPTALRGSDIASPSESSTDKSFAAALGTVAVHPAPDFQVVSQSNQMQETSTRPVPSNVAYYNQAKTMPSEGEA